MIPVSVIVVTKNEAARIAACLRPLLPRCGEVLVVDSSSQDATRSIANDMGAKVINFHWNGQYPKKRGWCLDNLSLKYDWVFWVDADEIVTDTLLDEIDASLAHNPTEAGFFVTGRYSMGGKILKHGIPNRKIALFHRKRMVFPVVDDLDIPGMGEIEGHYQPICIEGGRIGYLKAALVHDALDDGRAWQFRHEKYARWEAGMNQKNAWPVDPVPWRQSVKQFLRRSRFRGAIVFVVAYILKAGFLDGREGLELARAKRDYYQHIKDISL